MVKTLLKVVLPVALLITIVAYLNRMNAGNESVDNNSVMNMLLWFKKFGSINFWKLSNEYFMTVIKPWVSDWDTAGPVEQVIGMLGMIITSIGLIPTAIADVFSNLWQIISSTVGLMF